MYGRKRDLLGYCKDCGDRKAKERTGDGSSSKERKIDDAGGEPDGGRCECPGDRELQSRSDERQRQAKHTHPELCAELCCGKAKR